MNRRLRIPAKAPPLPGEPLALYLSVRTELRLQLVGEDASIVSGRPLAAAAAASGRTELLAKCVGPESHRGENPETPRHDYLTH
jgi:hypothetical protein